MTELTEFVDTGCEGWPSYCGTYIDFGPLPKDGKRTWRWQIHTRPVAGQGIVFLGEVKWFGRWVKYGFYPAPDCVFEATCLREIADFIEERTTEFRDSILKRPVRK